MGLTTLISQGINRGGEGANQDTPTLGTRVTHGSWAGPRALPIPWASAAQLPWAGQYLRA
jgi:hypothetical protein